jgi:hypothetical protein
MKHIYLIFCCYFSLFGTLLARSEMSEQNMIFRQIAMCLQEDNAEQSLKIPNRFDDVNSIKQMMTKSPYLLKYLNLLSIVPNTPVIKSHIDMVNGLKTYKLFAMNRVPCFDKVLAQNGPSRIHGGRFLFLINIDGNEYNPKWIPEPEVQFILKQLKDFDPEKQPLAFQDLNSEKGQRPPIENARNSAQPLPSEATNIATAPSLPKLITPAAVPVMTQNLISWLAGLVGLLVILLGYLGWRYFRRNARP